MIFKDEELNNAVENITNTFTGADGGIRFINFRITLEYLEKQSEEKDIGAKQLINIVKQFSRLIDVSQKNKEDFND